MEILAINSFIGALKVETLTIYLLQILTHEKKRNIFRGIFFLVIYRNKRIFFYFIELHREN